MSTPSGQGPEDPLREIERRSQVFPPPPPDLDLEKARADQLAPYGFPPKPDQQLQPDEYAIWSRVFTSKLTYVQASFTFNASQLLRSGAARPRLAGTRHQDSTNWSGGYIKPRDGRMITYLYGEWVVPPVSAPASAPAGAFFSSSTWIGLDGQRRYLHSSLPQIGTAQTAIAGQLPQPPTTWFQWWSRDQQHNCFVTLPPMASTGERVGALMVVISATQVVFSMVNFDTATLLLPFTVTAPTTSLGISCGSQVRLPNGSWSAPPVLSPALRQPRRVRNSRLCLQQRNLGTASPLPGGAC